MRQRIRALLHHARTENTQPARLGWAVGLGLFVGMLPLYGLHTLLCLALGFALRLNKATLVLASNISIPPMAPLLITAGITLGEWLRYGRVRPFTSDETRQLGLGLRVAWADMPDLFLSCLLGDAVLGAAFGGAMGLTVWRWAQRRAQEQVSADAR